MRGVALSALALLAACAPPVPDSTPVRVGDPFGRDVQLERGIVRTAPPILPPQQPVVGAPAFPTAPTTPVTDGASIAAETRAILGAPPIVPRAPDPTLNRNNAAISGEQDFGIVSESRSIEDDAERLRRARERFEVVPPPADLSRPDDAAPDVVGYALRQSRPIGTEAFGRNILATEGRSARRCSGFVNADAAQEAFLAAGGPERDPGNLDPDGDGNACGWDPATYRALLGTADG